MSLTNFTPHTLTHSLTHSLTQSLTHILTHTHSHTHTTLTLNTHTQHSHTTLTHNTHTHTHHTQERSVFPHLYNMQRNYLHTLDKQILVCMIGT